MIMEWKKLETQEDIEKMLKFYDHFEDTFLVRFTFESGNYVDSKEWVGYEVNDNNLIVRFDRLNNNLNDPYAIELLFERTRRMNCIFPFWGKDNWTAGIMYAKIVHNDEFFYWTEWRDFDQYNEEHLNYNDFMLIEAYAIKWRIIE